MCAAASALMLALCERLQEKNLVRELVMRPGYISVAMRGAERETDFIDIVAWRGTAEFVEKYFSKGRMIVVGGRLQIRNWQDKEGNKRRSAEILADSVYFGDSKRDGDGGKPKGEPTYDPTGGFSQLADDDSELPF